MWLFKWLSIAVVALTLAGASVTAVIPEPDVLGMDVPDPAAYAEPVVQVYGADVWGFRGRFAIHTWIAVKPRNAGTYTVYQVIGWRLRRHGTVLSIAERQPDLPWFGSPALLLLDRRGPEVDALIEHIDAAARGYPYQHEYRMWPGPNSNSFTAWVALEVPELGLELPFKAIGKNWMAENHGLTPVKE